MAVYIGHASIDENGKASGGTAGDQTGKEVCKRTWYSKPWDYMAVYPDKTVLENIAAFVEACCANDKIGYDQGGRNTLYKYAKAAGFKPAKITTACECDCSSLVNCAVVAAGLGSYGSNGWTTTTLKTQLSALGFKIITDSAYLKSSAYCVRGAIYVKAGSHVVTGLTNGTSKAKTYAKAGIKTTLTVNGTLNKATVKALQTWLGTTVDGVISDQPTKYKQYYVSYGSAAVEFKSKNSGGSAVIKALKKEIGHTNTTGYLGTNGIKTLQKYLGVSQTGKLDKKTVKALQRKLNKV